VAAALLILILLPEIARAQTRTSLSLNGFYVPGASSFAESRTFTEFAEAGSIHATYRAQAGPGLEARLRYMVSRRLGFAAALGYLDRGESSAYSAAIPHPLYFERPRPASGTTAGQSYRETVSDLDLVFVPTSNRHREIHIFAGVSLFKVRADLIDHIQYTQAYPYDTVSAVSAPMAAVQDNPVGFNLGAGLDQKLGGHFGLGVYGRYSRARAILRPSPGNALGLEAGGFQVGGGVRLFF
jgi:hypothetical protein